MHVLDVVGSLFAWTCFVAVVLHTMFSGLGSGREPRDEFLGLPGNRRPWADFAADLGLVLETEDGEVRGRYAGVGMRVELPKSYLGGRGVVRLEGDGAGCELETRPPRWWNVGTEELEVVGGDSERVPPPLAKLLVQHDVSLEVAGRCVRAALPQCKVDVVRALLPHLARLVTAPDNYRRAYRAVS